uniref:Putative ribosomal protein L6 n=3 Tax=Sporobolomyces TaxID=5429 RepID=G8H2M9_9BASI|nr:putative ribosomal protein L6 [Sporobolomyces longiusculus]
MVSRSSSLGCVPRALLRRQFSSSPRVPSHVGSAPIPYPPAVTFEFATLAAQSGPDPSSSLVIQGPKGRLAVNVPSFVNIDFSVPPTSDAVVAGSTSPPASLLSVAVKDASIKQQQAAWGLTRSLVANAVRGVSEGYTLSLRLVGVGYRAAVEDLAPSPSGSPTPRQRLNLKLGFAHPVLIALPPDVVASTPSSTTITLSGIDKQRLGEVAARIRSWRVPEPYNGKGIFVGDEQVKRKEVKKK